MKLTKKHIGGLFDVYSSDGSWFYQLVDVKDGKLLFYSSSDNWEIEFQAKYNDWRIFAPQKRSFSKAKIKYGWETGRLS